MNKPDLFDDGIIAIAGGLLLIIGAPVIFLAISFGGLVRLIRLAQASALGREVER